VPTKLGIVTGPIPVHNPKSPNFLLPRNPIAARYLTALAYFPVRYDIINMTKIVKGGLHGAAFFAPIFDLSGLTFMTNKGIDIQHPKLRGEWAELRFMVRAAEHGLRVSKPFGDCARYDVAVEAEGQFLRVQVKSIGRKPEHGYRCNLITRAGPYTSEDMDVVAIYVINLELWYIIPGKAFEGRSSVKLYPGKKQSKFGEFEEAWHLLCGGSKTKPSAGPRERDQPGAADASPEDKPRTITEARFDAIRERLLAHPWWKPQR
jgi:hypothetical protein